MLDKLFWLAVSLCIIIICFLSFISNKENRIHEENEKYDGYDYDAENPNALVSGENIAGTVYASYPDNSPGLGWIV